MNLKCPYCQSESIESISQSTDDSLEDLDLGCLGLYFHLYPDGELKLYTERDFFEAFKKSQRL